MLEAIQWLSELIDRERLFDAPMHFTPARLAESCALAIILHGGTTMRDGQNCREGFLKHANRMLGRANGSFSMGKEFYSNINRLYYLHDDFNDRSRHSAHAQSMLMADLLGLYGVLMTERKP